MDKIVLYSTGCPKCKILVAKLDQLGVAYEVNSSIEDMHKIGISAVPVLEVGNRRYEFSEAVKLINSKL